MPAILFMSGFAAVWWAIGAVAWGRPALALVGVAVSAAVMLAARRRLRETPAPDAAERRRIGRVVGWAAGGEAVAMLVVLNLLRNLGLDAYVTAAMAAIVGLHFLPLAALLKVRTYWLTAAALCALGAGGALLDPGLRTPVVGLAAAAILWATCAGWVAERAAPRSGNRPSRGDVRLRR